MLPVPRHRAPTDFVAQQKLGVGDQRACNRNTLTLATGEFVRVAARITTIEPDFLECLVDPVTYVLAREIEEHHEWASEHLIDAGTRVQRRIGVLEYELDFSTLRPRYAAQRGVADPRL